MADQTRKVYIGIALIVALSLAIVLLAPPPMVPGQSFVIASKGTTIPVSFMVFLRLVKVSSKGSINCLRLSQDPRGIGANL